MIRKLFLPIDNAGLILFRIFFGLLLSIETFGAIFTGWVKHNFIDPKFTFSYIGMEWIQPLPGNGMYFYFAVMGVLGLLVMFGYKYRFSIGLFTILWAGAYFMQKSSYNNHYYLLLLISLIMFFLPANRFCSLDVRKNPAIRSYVMPQWCSWVMILQISIVYFFASISKVYPGWMDGTFINIAFKDSTTNALLQELFSQRWFHIFIAYSGIVFDLFIVPLLLWKRTRTIAFVASIFFHLFNALFLKIGIFPFFALSFVVFFYPAEKVRKLFFSKQVAPEGQQTKMVGESVLKYFFIPYFIIQLALPVRHYFIKGDVLWTEEGHRMSWRMMLRARSGYTEFKVRDNSTGEVFFYDLRRHLSAKQISFVGTKPDGIWQMAQYIKKEYKAKGKDVSIFVDSKIAINHGDYKPLVNPETDFAKAKWDYFFHNEWVLLYDENGRLIR